ncbi:ATP-dependent DNA helicase pfh1 [Folsomia candida]|uniref:ATP-dependent DNA helicase n=1 Tax=Folsomia candida TaxID=158441 RepID=A0A226CZG3_FOLCA|nr:ATP-dependent DNA helicase pfh1 [Folsomia candida]
MPSKQFRRRKKQQAWNKSQSPSSSINVANIEFIEPLLDNNNRDSQLNDQPCQEIEEVEQPMDVDVGNVEIGRHHEETPEQILFMSNINQAADCRCRICDRTWCKKGIKRLTVTQVIYDRLADIGNKYDPIVKAQLLPFVSEIIDCCCRCHDNLKKGKVPATALVNNMFVPASPEVIVHLSEIECRMISRAKAFLKIFKLGRGRGQAALKGQVIHFAQSVEEVQEQLRLGPDNNYGTIIVTESVGNFPHPSIYEIRPRDVRDALNWLLRHNPSYSNVTIDQFRIDAIQLKDLIIQEEHQDTSPSPAINIRRRGHRIQTTFAAVAGKPWMSSLELSFCQSADIFADSAGKQCTAICAVAAAYAAVKPPGGWTVQDGDRIMTEGDHYYNQCRENLSASSRVVHNEHHLTADEIIGDVNNCYGKIVRVSLVDGGTVIYGAFDRFLHDAGPITTNSVAAAVSDFLNFPYSYGLLTAGAYTMGLIGSEEHIFYFDSHARSKQGHKSFARSGKGVILKLDRSNAASINHINSLVNKNCVAGTNSAVITITPLNLAILDDPQTNTDLPANDNPAPVPEPAAFGEEALEDCLLHPTDFVEPRLESIRLNRTAAPCIRVNDENHLEEKCFVKCFPHGQFGLDEERDQRLRLTTHAYFQNRVMSTDSRFHRNDYLFYALSRSEESIIQSKINVCGNMKYQDSENDNAPAAENLHLYMSAIRGSRSYWKKYTGDIMAMISRLGTPTFFLTVSYDDMGSPDVLTAMWKACHEKNDPLPNKIEDLPFEVRRELLNSNPVAAARHFNLRTQELIKLLTTDVTIFGKPVVDYTFRVEFQDRGSPHLHSLIWVDNPPDFSSTEGIAFIDRNVSCRLEGTGMDDIVRRYQWHKDTTTCFKKGSECRFGFPRPLATKTTIKPDESSRGRGVILQRKKGEERINNYHPKLLGLLRCNMDIQVVIGVAGVAYYIAKYIGKNEPETLREDIRHTLQTLRDSRRPIRVQMQKVSRLLLSRRTVGSQEAAYRMVNIPMRHSSRGFVFIPTYLPGDRIRLLKKNAYLERDEVQFASNIIDKYCNRPDSLANLSLFEFASKYQPVQNYQHDDDDLDEGREQIQEERSVPVRQPPFYLKDRTLGMWKERGNFAIVKSPPFNSDSDHANFIYSHLLLYVPFANENFLVDGESVEEAYERNKADMRTTENFPLIRPDMEKLLEAAVLNAATFRETDAEIIFEGEDDFEHLPDVYNASNVLPAQENYSIPGLNETDFEIEGSKMNEHQRQIYDMVNQHITDPSHGQFQLFISGAGGTGKSFLISLLSTLIRTKVGGPGLSSLILAAPTGVAALNINGQTLHRAFHLAVESGSVPRYAPLGAQMLQRMRDKFSEVEWIIMDEVSMISYEKFAFCELTLNMRQGQDPILNICNNLREGQITSADLHKLRSREFNEETSSVDIKDKFKDAIRIYPTRNQAAVYNRRKTTNLRDDPNIKVYQIKARDTFFTGTKAGTRARLAYSHRDSNKCGGFLPSIELAVGSRIMVIRNSQNNRYLVNGSMGTVVGFNWDELARDQHHQGDLPSSIRVTGY